MRSRAASPVDARRRPKRQKGEVRRVQIAQAALRILAQKGPGRLTAAELAREVGIADGTIFRHFKDKREIVLTAVGSLRELFSRDFPPPRTLAPLERLDALVRSRLRLALEQPNLYALALGEQLVETVGEAGLAPLRELWAQTEDFVAQCIRDAQEQGAIDARLAVGPLSLLFAGALQSAASRCAPGREPRGGPPEAVWQTLRALLCRTGAPGRAAAREVSERRAQG